MAPKRPTKWCKAGSTAPGTAKTSWTRGSPRWSSPMQRAELRGAVCTGFKCWPIREPSSGLVGTASWSINRYGNLDRGIYGGFLDVPHRLRVGGDGFLHCRGIAQLLRRDAVAGEQDLRPDCLDLRAVTARHLPVKLNVDFGTYRLIDGCPGVTSTQIEVGGLFLADRCRRKIDNDDDLLRSCVTNGKESEDHGAQR